MHQSITNLNNIQNSIRSNQVNTSNRNSIKIIAVSKTFEMDHISPLVEYGHKDFGENKVQEALKKWEPVKIKYKNISLHLIGKLQSNKTKVALKIFDYIHSLDNEKLANRISDEQKSLEKKPKLFIQVNIGNEEQKNGIDPDKLKSFYQHCLDKDLNVIGTMCLPPLNEKPEKYFIKMNQLNKNLGLKELSMGMSGDYISAIEHNATYIRVGSKIFGERKYK